MDEVRHPREDSEEGEPLAVTGPDCAVRGVAGLWVADASIMFYDAHVPELGALGPL